MARLWDAASGRPLGHHLPHQDPVWAMEWVYAVAFSPNGKTILTGSADRTARLWDVATGRPLGPPLEHQSPVCAVAFSPDGKTIRLWEVGSGRPVGAPLSHPSFLMAVAFSPDGKTILAGGYEMGARLWD